MFIIFFDKTNNFIDVKIYKTVKIIRVIRMLKSNYCFIFTNFIENFTKFYNFIQKYMKDWLQMRKM